MPHLYIGHYLRVPVTTRSVEKRSYACSAKCGCSSLSDKTRFCPQCGSPVEVVVSAQALPHLPDPGEVKGTGFEDLMWLPSSSREQAATAGYVVWLPNRRGQGLTLQDDKQVELDLGRINPSESLPEFERMHAAFITAATEQLGITPQVAHGLVTYRF